MRSRAWSLARTVSALAGIDHESGGFVEELAQRRDGLRGEVRLGERLFHQLDPAVAAALVDGERRVAHAQARVPALLRVPHRTAETLNEKVAQSQLRRGEFGFGI